jgi:hypothetical protein
MESKATKEVTPSESVPDLPEAVKLIDTWLHKKRVSRNRMLMRALETSRSNEELTQLAKLFIKSSIFTDQDIGAYYLKACDKFKGDHMKSFDPYDAFADFWDDYQSVKLE